MTTLTARDIPNDKSGRLESWVRDNFIVPDWAEGFSKEASASQPKSAYAWPEARLFPVGTREDTWWSAVSLGRVRQTGEAPDEVIEKVADNLGNALSFWNISGDSFKPAEKEVEKEASAVFSLELRVKGAPVDKVECVTQEDFNKTAEWLSTTGRLNYPYESRRDAAREMLTSPLSENLPETARVELEKTAGYGAVSRGSMISMLDILSKGLDKLGYQEFNGILNSAKDECPDIMTGSELDKTACMLDGVHRALRVMKKAEGVNMPPLEEMLNIQTPTMLEKAGASFIVLPDGRFIDDDEFEKNAERILGYVTGVLEKKASLDNLRDVVEGLNEVESAEFTEAMVALGI